MWRDARTGRAHGVCVNLERRQVLILADKREAGEHGDFPGKQDWSRALKT